jgi:hypothetical protein
MKQSDLFKKIVTRLRRHGGGPTKPKIMHPGRDWWIGIFIALVLFIGASAWSANTYLSYRHLTVNAETTEAVQPMVYRASMVASALELFADRDVLHIAFQEGIKSGKWLTKSLAAEDIEESGSTSTATSSAEIVSESEVLLDSGTTTESTVEDVATTTAEVEPAASTTIEVEFEFF